MVFKPDCPSKTHRRYGSPKKSQARRLESGNPDVLKAEGLRSSLVDCTRGKNSHVSPEKGPGVESILVQAAGPFALSVTVAASFPETRATVQRPPCKNRCAFRFSSH